MVGAIVGAKAVESASKSKATKYIVGGVVIVVLVGSFFITKKVLETLQIIDTGKERRDKKAVGKLTTEQAFNPTHAKNKPSKVTISEQKASALARDLYFSSGWVGAENSSWWNPLDVIDDSLASVGAKDDDEAKVYGAIRSAGTTYNLSKVAGVMYKKYKVGLLEHLSFLSNSGLAKVKEIVDNYKS